MVPRGKYGLPAVTVDVGTATVHWSCVLLSLRVNDAIGRQLHSDIDPSAEKRRACKAHGSIHHLLLLL